MAKKRRSTFALEFMTLANKYHKTQGHSDCWIFCHDSGCLKNNEFCDKTFDPPSEPTLATDLFRFAEQMVTREEIFGPDDQFLRELELRK